MENITQTSPESDSASINLVDLTGQTLADYHILRKLGQGGMGQVYLAEQVSLKRKVALKLLKAELAANEVALKRFKQEAEAVARVTHANIVQVYNIGEANGQHYMALEYVEGRNLRDYITRKGPPELLLALSIMRQTAGALQRAAELGIIHRDIKPENILLTRKGEVKVADFGLSRALEGDQPAVSLTQSGVTMGTPLYMSPEQVEGKQLDPRTDIYSFGVTCYHMFAGEPPFRGSTAFEVALQHVRNDPTPLDSIRPDLPTEVCAVVHKMMAKDPAQRYQSGRELLKDLVRLRESINGNTGFLPLASTGFVDQPIGGSVPSSKSVPLVAPKRRRGWLVVLFFLSVLAAAAGGAYVGFNQQKNRSPADEEAAEVEPRLAIESTPLLDSEQMFKKLVDQHLNPARGFDNPKSSLHDCLRLAVVYLDNDKLDEAESLFERMEGVHQIELYHVTGKLGRAMVLSLRDKWNASHEAFRDLQMDRKKPVDIPRVQTLTEILRTNLGFTRWLKEAVHRNEVNSKGAVDKTMPQYLRFLARKDVPRPSDKPPKDNKPGPKKPDPPTMQP